MLSLESRRAAEIEKLIRARGGDPFVAPSMREVPLSTNTQAFDFAEKLFAGEVELMVFLTGVGARILSQAIELRHPQDAFQDALRQIPVAVRGPKPAAVMREWNIPVVARAAEPNTWRELLEALKDRPEKRIWVQEYGRTSEELVAGLAGRGVEVHTVPVYQWALPEDTAALREAAHKLVAGEFRAAMFTTSVQMDHLMRIAAQEGIAKEIAPALRRIAVISIGPTTTEALAEHEIPVDMEPSHPRMGIMIAEASEKVHQILDRKA